MKKQILYRKRSRFLKLYLAISLLSLVILLLFFISSSASLKSELIEDVEDEITAFSNVFLDEISQLSTDVFLITDLLEVQDSLTLNGTSTEFTSEIEKNTIEEEFLVWLKTKEVYDQIRILDNTGQEIVRVNYNAGTPTIVDEDDLQNKADRYYFTESIILNDRDLYMSLLDLNIENGEIEVINGETKPMLRVATPIFSDDGSKLGVVVINYLVQDLFDNLDALAKNDIRTIEIINENGYYLYAIDQAIEFGFMYDNLQDETFLKYHDHDIQSSLSGVVVSDEHDGKQYSLIVLSGAELTAAATGSNTDSLNIEFATKEFIIFSEITLTKTLAYNNLVELYIILAITVLILSFVISRLIDEAIHLNNENIKRIKYDALNDLLTGLPNRKSIYEQIQNQIQRRKKFTVLFIDFDGFKDINDNFGHDIGDEALIQGTARILNAIRFDDTLGRLGGDEFIVILKDLSDETIVARICNEIIDSFLSPFDLFGNQATLSVSIGAFICEDNKYSIDEIINKADRAMYEVKNTGKNNFLVSKDVKTK